MCARGDVDVLVCKAQDRLARDTEIWPQIRKASIQAHTRIETVKEGNLTAKGSEFIGDIYAAVAAEERRTIAERVSGGRVRRSTRDGLGSGPIVWPYLKLMSGTFEHPIMTIGVDEEAAKVVRLILQARDEGATYQEIADRLNASGVLTPKGKEWTRGHVKLIDQERELYTTGRRVWGNVTAKEIWPKIYAN